MLDGIKIEPLFINFFAEFVLTVAFPWWCSSVTDEDKQLALKNVIIA